MYTIVVPVGGDEHGIERAAAFVGGLPGDASVIVVNARKDIDVVGSEGGRVSIDHEDLTVPETVDLAADAFAEYDVPVERELRVGDPTEAVLDAATEHDADQIVVPTKKRSPVGKFVFGSVTLELIRESPVAVTIAAE